MVGKNMAFNDTINTINYFIVLFFTLLLYYSYRFYLFVNALFYFFLLPVFESYFLFE